VNISPNHKPSKLFACDINRILLPLQWMANLTKDGQGWQEET